MSAMTNYMETKILNAMRGTAAAAPVSIERLSITAAAV